LMETIIARLIPLYVVAFLGYLAGRKLKVTKESLAPILIYILSPAVVFFAVLQTTLDSRILYLPIISFSIGTMVCAISFWLSKFFFSGAVPNLIGFASGDANGGYFGIPVALALFGSELLPAYIMIVFGLIIYENTVGYYVTARGNFDHREAIRRIQRLPSLYAFFTAIILNILNIKVSGPWADIGLSLRGAYSVLGMMIIGLGIASLPHWKIDWKMIAFVSVTKFILWPILIVLLIVLDVSTLKIISPELFPLLLFFSTLPLAANTVTFASELRVEPERASVAVLASTIVATFYIPFMYGSYKYIAEYFRF